MHISFANFNSRDLVLHYNTAMDPCRPGGGRGGWISYTHPGRVHSDWLDLKGVGAAQGHEHDNPEDGGINRSKQQVGWLQTSSPAVAGIWP